MRLDISAPYVKTRNIGFSSLQFKDIKDSGVALTTRSVTEPNKEDSMTDFSTQLTTCDIFNCRNSEKTHTLVDVTDNDDDIFAVICPPCADLLTRMIKSMLKGAK